MTEKYLQQMRISSQNICILGERLKRLYEDKTQNNTDILSEEIMSVRAGLEREALNVRSLCTVGENIRGCIEKDSVSNSLNIVCEEEKDWLRIQIPLLIPQGKGYPKFITTELISCLERFQEDDPIEKFGKCVIVFRYCYDVALGVVRIRDYDNIEFKPCLDVVEEFFLDNDSAMQCSVYHTSALLDMDKTEIYVMNPSKFERWLKKYGV